MQGKQIDVTVYTSVYCSQETSKDFADKRKYLYGHSITLQLQLWKMKKKQKKQQQFNWLNTI